MNTVIRNARAGDEARMAEIQVTAWRRAYAGIMSPALLDSMRADQKTDMWRNALEQPEKGCYIVSEVDGQIEGFAVFGPARDPDLTESESAEIVSINIAPDRWRAGLGSSLLESIVSRGGYKQLYLWVVWQNNRAVTFYQHHGFASEGSIKAVPKHSGVEEVRFARNLLRDDSVYE